MAEPEEVKDAIAALHREHPQLSVPALHEWIVARYGRKYRIPSVAAMRQALAERGYVKPPGSPLPAGYKPPIRGVTGPNQIWCAEVGEFITCADGKRTAPFAVVDAFTGYIIRLEVVYEKLYEVEYGLRGALAQMGTPDEIRVRPQQPFMSDEVAGLTTTSFWLMRAGMRVDRRPRAPFVSVVPRLDPAPSPAIAQRQLDALRKARNLEPGPASYVKSKKPKYQDLLDTRNYASGDMVFTGKKSRFRWRGRAYQLDPVVHNQIVTLSPWDLSRWDIRLGTISLGMIDLWRPELGIIPPPVPQVMSMVNHSEVEEVNWDQLYPADAPERVAIIAERRAARSASRPTSNRAPRRRASKPPSP